MKKNHKKNHFYAKKQGSAGVLVLLLLGFLIGTTMTKNKNAASFKAKERCDVGTQNNEKVQKWGL